MNWLQRLERSSRKNRRLRIRNNVRAYRQRQKRAGMHRIDVALRTEQYAILAAAMVPGESISETLGRLLESFTGNTS